MFTVTEDMRNEIKKHYEEITDGSHPSHVLIFQFEDQEWDFVFCKNFTHALDLREQDCLTSEDSAIISVYKL